MATNLDARPVPAPDFYLGLGLSLVGAAMLWALLAELVLLFL